jgi:hypothetical protein
MIICSIHARRVCTAIETVMGTIARGFPDDYALIRQRVRHFVPKTYAGGYGEWDARDGVVTIWPGRSRLDLQHPLHTIAHELGHACEQPGDWTPLVGQYKPGPWRQGYKPNEWQGE